MGNRGYVADRENFKAETLHRTHRRFATRTWTLDSDIDLLETMSHGLAAGILRDHLRSVCCTLP